MQALKQHIKTIYKDDIEHVFVLDIAVNFEHNNAVVVQLNMEFTIYNGEPEFGDLGVVYTCDDSIAEQLAADFYLDSMLREKVIAALVNAGVPDEIAADVDYSEAGMQDLKIASMDAIKLGELVLAIMQES